MLIAPSGVWAAESGIPDQPFAAFYTLHFDALKMFFLSGGYWPTLFAGGAINTQ
jgi:hypothetical protein